MDESASARQPSAAPIAWGIAQQALEGQEYCGDQYVAKVYPGGLLAAVIDGLGHGENAAQAAGIAASTLEAYAHEPPEQLIKRCHQNLKHSRGVVMSLAVFSLAASSTPNRVSKAELTWLGVGNVKGVLVRVGDDRSLTYEWLLLRGGIVGYNLPSLRPVNLPLAPGDTLIFVTDGIRSSFGQALTPQAALLPSRTHNLDIAASSPQHIADSVLAHYRRETDDALVLVVRYMGNPAHPAH